jgi:Rieske 2Fe-2S family protein
VTAGTTDDLAEPGAYVTCEAGTTPLLVLRGHDGQLRAFVNMCRHRGMALLEGCGVLAGNIECPYHAWKFDTAGRLRVIAQRAAEFPGVEPADWGLLPAAVIETGGLIYAHPDDSAVFGPAGVVPADLATRYLLPAEAYYSQEWYEREIAEIFLQHWALVGYAADVRTPGSSTVGYCGPARITVTRDGAGTLRAVRDGIPDADRSACAVATWKGLVFAHPDPDTAPPLEEWLAGFPSEEFVGRLPLDDIEQVYRVQWDLACNWKLYIENHIDIYHLWYLHSESLGMNDHHALGNRWSGPHWQCDEPRKDGAEQRRESLPRMTGVDDEEARLTRANLIFPNVCWSSSSGNSVATYQVIPTGPETCTLDLRIRAMPGSAMSDKDEAATKTILYDEDGFACEQMQRVVRAPQFQVGPLAQSYEQPIMDFHELLLRHLQG